MITKANEVKLNVLPLLCTIEHRYYYEGPCRFGKGEALQPGYDRLANAQKTETFLAKLNECASEGINIMEPATVSRTDDWENSEANWEAIAPAAREADFVVVMTGIACDDMALEFAERFKKPIAVTPISGFSGTIAVAALNAKACNEYEVYGFYKWEDLAFQMKVLRARKVIQTTRILCVNRFGSNTSYSSVDAFNMHDEITQRLGVRFRFVNVHEFFDCMSPAQPEGNHTTPGRKTPNLTDEDLAKANAVCNDLCAGAKENSMTREKMLPSCIAFVTARKYMDLKDCNGFTMPCPDACSTRRLNEGQFTMCLTHSLNMEEGIPSACEYDTDAVLSQQALIAVSGKRPYMGNTCPVPYENGHLSARFGTTPEQLAELEKDPRNHENLYMMQHSVAHRRLADPDKNSPYAIRNFAYDQGFAVTLRYDFDADAGQKITMCRFAPDGSKLFIGTGEIVMGGGYDGYNCSQLVYFRVKNQADTWAKQCMAGNHCTLVYGDYVKELTALAESLGIEPLVAD
ncbi:MAG: fucose isomerase [Oscillospiraceae bacterium]|nr:fucose isomerase [Oscillospiraceae bacterium]